MFLFILEGLGTSELLLILVVALIIFGPRKLPQLSRQLGKSLADFRRASEDFKQTWEKEVGRESVIHEALVGEAMLPEDRSILNDNRDRSQADRNLQCVVNGFALSSPAESSVRAVLRLRVARRRCREFRSARRHGRWPECWDD